MAPQRTCIDRFAMALLAAGVVLWLPLAATLRAQEAPAPATAPPSAPAPAPGTETSPPGAAAAPSAATTPETPETPFILRPYVVEVLLSFPADASFGANHRAQLIAEIETEIASRFRQMWVVKVQQVADARRYDAAKVRDALADSVTEQFKNTTADKIFLVGLERAGAICRAVSREWDANSRTLSPISETATNDPRIFGHIIVQGVVESFRPLAQGEVLEEGNVDFLVRAGELLPADESVAQFRPGDFLIPYLRYLDRNGQVRQVQMQPWTYFKVESADRSRVHLAFISAFRFPFSTARRRIEVMAMRARPQFPSTELMIYPRGSKANPLVGYRCEVLDRVPTDEDPVEERLKLITDRRGIVTIPADPKSPQKYLMVYSGESLLARVPLMPGLERSLSLEVPDDRARLRVEGEVKLLEGELIDIVATREVVMARIRGSMQKKEWQKVDELLKELDQLPAMDNFLARIDTLQVQATFRARQLKDKVQENRVARLCKDISELSKKHLDPARLNEFRDDVRRERQEP